MKVSRDSLLNPSFIIKIFLFFDKFLLTCKLTRAIIPSSEGSEAKMNENLNAPRKRYDGIDMDQRAWLLLALSLIPAGMLWIGDMWENEIWMALNLPAVHMAILLLSLIAVRKRARFSLTTGLLTAAEAALIILGVFHRNSFLMGANCLIIPMLTGISLLSAAEINRSDLLSLQSLGETLARGICGLFAYIPLPAFHLFRNTERLRKLAGALLALILCIPILMVVLVLLADADEVFLGWFENLFELLPDFTESPLLPRLILTVATALMLFSWSFTLTQRGREYTLGSIPRIPAIFPEVLLTLLNVVYALFVYIQFSNLFGGAESAAMTGGYAQYARSGFFQLTAVAAINLVVISLAIRTSRSGWIRAMALVMIAATGVILASALWRMQLYIETYGLTVLRVLTLWGMSAIAVLLIIACLSIFIPGFKAFRTSMLCMVALWLALNAVNIDAIIADHNVDAYLSGELAEIDADYLRSLSASEAALRRLEES